MRFVVVVNDNYTMEAKAYMVRTKQAAINKIHVEYIKALQHNRMMSPYESYISEEDMYACVTDGLAETIIRAIVIENS